MSLKVYLSNASDGSMRPCINTTSEKADENLKNFFLKNNLDIKKSNRIQLSYDRTNYCDYLVLAKGEVGKITTNSDALITNNIGNVLSVTLADCIGAAIYDPDNNILMLSHLGRHSLEQDGFIKSIDFMKSHFGSKEENIIIHLSSAAAKSDYQIYARENHGLKEELYIQLSQTKIEMKNVHDDIRETTKDDGLFSHSQTLKGNLEKDGRTIMLAVISPDEPLRSAP